MSVSPALVDGDHQGLRLTWLDLLLVAVLAVAALGAGRLLGAAIVDQVLGEALEDPIYEIRSRVLEERDSLATVEKRQQKVRERLVAEEIELVDQRQQLAGAKGSTLDGLKQEITAHVRLAEALRREAKDLVRLQGEAKVVLARAEDTAKKRRSAAQRRRRWEEGALRAACSLMALPVLVALATGLRWRVGAGIHLLPVAIGAAFLLVTLLVVDLSGWVVAAILAVGLLTLIARGGSK